MFALWTNGIEKGFSVPPNNRFYSQENFTSITLILSEYQVSAVVDRENE